MRALRDPDPASRHAGQVAGPAAAPDAAHQQCFGINARVLTGGRWRPARAVDASGSGRAVDKAAPRPEWRTRCFASTRPPGRWSPPRPAASSRRTALNATSCWRWSAPPGPLSPRSWACPTFAWPPASRLPAPICWPSTSSPAAPSSCTSPARPSSGRSAARWPPPPRSRAGTPPSSPPSPRRSRPSCPATRRALVLVAGGFDPRALATVEWLAKRHGVEASCFSVSVLRFGNERLLCVRREPRDGQSPDPAAQVQWMLTGARRRRARGARRRSARGQHAAAGQLAASVPQRGPVRSRAPRGVLSSPPAARPAGRGRTAGRGTRRSRAPSRTPGRGRISAG